MKLIVEENTQKMSESALHILLGAMMQDKRVNISLTSGRSPIELYKMLAPEVRDQEKFKDIEYYLCGPPMMSKTVLDVFDKLGVEPENIRYDNFG